MFRALDSAELEKTLRCVRDRIGLRFPGSGLASVSAELAASARACFDEVARQGRPLWWLRGAVAAAVLLLLALPLEAHLLLRLPMRFNSFGEFIQAADAGFNILLLLAGAAIFLVSAENRLKRRRALLALHELRSLAHVIDMHQISKDPGIDGTTSDAAGDGGQPKETVRSGADLWHYLSFCTDLLTVTAKVAACFAHRQSDRTVLDTINDIETLSTSLSRKIWQKMSFLRQPDPARDTRGAPPV